MPAQCLYVTQQSLPAVWHTAVNMFTWVDSLTYVVPSHTLKFQPSELQTVAPPPCGSVMSSTQLVMHTAAAVARHHLTAGSSSGIRTALALTRPMGTVVLKSTVSSTDAASTPWAEVANDVVVNEKQLVGSRCGPGG